MNTTPAQRAEWAKLDKERPGAWRDPAYRSAVPSLIADVEELLADVHERTKVNHELLRRRKAQLDEKADLQAEVERLTALLRDIMAGITAAVHSHIFGTESCRPDCLRCRIEKELQP